MSLLWPNQLLVSLSQESVAIVQLAGLNKRIQQKKHVQFAKSGNGWQQAVEQMALMLVNKQQFKSDTLRVVLASEFARYMALPPQAGAMRDNEKLDFARAVYREVYGNTVDTWHIKCDDVAPNQTIIAVAVDLALIETLNTLAKSYDMRLESVQPYLMPVFNRTKSQLSTGEIYLALVEASRLLFVSLNKGQWQKIRSFAREPDWRTQLKSIAQREGLNEEAAKSHTLMVYAPQDKTSSLPNLAGWNLQRLIVDARGLKSDGQHFAMLEAV